jgi:hypothetical protein
MSQSSNLGNGIDLLLSDTLATRTLVATQPYPLLADSRHPAETPMAEPY